MNAVPINSFYSYRRTFCSYVFKTARIYTLRVRGLTTRDICGVSKQFGEWYQKTNKTEDTNNLTSLAFKINAILHNTLMTTFIKLL
jgi:hypothetical protein